MTTSEHPCMIREFDGCRCKSADECQSFAAELERRRASRKSQRDAEATVRAKQAAERAVLVVLAVISIAAVPASLVFFGAPESQRLERVHQEQVAVR